MISYHGSLQVPTLLQTLNLPGSQFLYLQCIGLLIKCFASHRQNVPLKSSILYGPLVRGQGTTYTIHGVIGAVLLWPLLEAKGLECNNLGCAKYCRQLAPCDCRSPKNRIQSVFFKEGAMNTLCLGDQTLPRKGGTEQDIVGEETETKINLSKMATRWDFFFLPEV